MKGTHINTIRKSSAILLSAILLLSLAVAACSPVAPSAPAASPTTRPATPTPSAATAAGSGIVNGKFAGEAQALDGTGATFPAVLYTKWFDEYAKLTGVKVNYQAIGSGGGIKAISDQTADFGATDGPMTDEQLKAAKGGEVFHIPAALGAVVPTYNVPEIGTATLKFSPESLAGIFLGQITKWNDPKIAADNPGVTLPNKEIVVVHRSDGSGTTYIWVDYLAAVSKEWKDKVGVATSVNWPVGIGGQGNAGVAGEVKQTQYTLGYVELIYAIQNKLGYGYVKNKAGKYIEPSLQSVTAAASGAAKDIVPDLRASIVNAEGDTSYPVSGFTWLLIYKTQTDRVRAQALSRMAWWATHDGQKYNTELGYAPLPDDIVKRAEEKILSITVGGQKAFPHDPTKKP